ncbi:MAG: N-acetyltransferase [Spirochaetaceae bacterium]|nr:N-acetyltransferase [Spirochaetaceae bacterium]MBQ8353327.1 N-acetyltransferase [Spirochaetaceae bacterium]
MNEKIKIRVEEQEDYEIVENLTRDSFWNVYRPGCTEHFVLNRFRDNPDFIPELSLVLEINGEILGHIMFSWSKIQCDDGNVIRTLTFGPVSIHPNYQRQGLGKKLVDFSTEKAKSFCNTCILICGNPEFYGKCGFSDALSFGIRYGDEIGETPFFLCKELKTGSLSGISGKYVEPSGYFVAENYPKEFEEYEKKFPYKEKLVL